MSRSQSWQRATVLLLVVLFVIFACKKTPAPAPPPPTPAAVVTPPPPPCNPPTIALRADAVTVQRGSAITLTWNANNAAAVDIQPGIGAVTTPGNGNRQVSPASSVTYTATATSPCGAGPAADTLRVTVTEPPPPPPPTVAPPPPPARGGVTSVSLDTLFTQNMQPILFDYDKADIRGDQTSKLQTASAFLKSNPSVRLTVEGHCDERGSEQYNQALGERRANAVKQFFLSQGIADTRISTISYGEERPVCKEQTEDCFTKNRRAAFTKN